MSPLPRLELRPALVLGSQERPIGPERLACEHGSTLGLAGERHVVQRYLPEVDVPFGDPPTIARMKHELDVFAFGSQFAGYMCRASVDTVINVGRRGVKLPVMIVPDPQRGPRQSLLSTACCK